MTTNLQQNPYLREQRDFPPNDPKSLAVQIDRAYIDIAQAVNNRTIGIFALNAQLVTGKSWYLQGSSAEQQTLRQLYAINGSGSFPHGINLSNIAGFTRIYGTFTDNEDTTLSNWYPLPYVDITDITNQVLLQVTQTDIIVTAGSGATIVSGWVVLEWLSLV